MSKQSFKLAIKGLGLRTACLASLLTSSCGNMAPESENIQKTSGNSALTQPSNHAAPAATEQTADGKNTKSRKKSDSQNQSADEESDFSKALDDIAETNKDDKLSKRQQVPASSSVDKNTGKKASESPSQTASTIQNTVTQSGQGAPGSSNSQGLGSSLGGAVLSGNNSAKIGDQKQGPSGVGGVGGAKGGVGGVGGAKGGVGGVGGAKGGVGGVGGAKGGVGGIGGAKGGVGKAGAILNREGSTQQRLDDILKRVGK